MTAELWVAVAGVSIAAISIIANAIVSVRRLSHEEQMQQKRLLHERRLAHEAKAAAAYRDAERVQRVWHWDAIRGIAGEAPRYAAAFKAEDTTPPPSQLELASAPIQSAVDAITEAKAYAWSEKMAEACGGLLVALVIVERQGRAAIARLRDVYQQIFEEGDPMDPPAELVAQISGPRREVQRHVVAVRRRT